MKQIIFSEYAALNRQLHEQNPEFGAHGGEKAAPQVINLCRNNGLRSVLDFGCGKGQLKRYMAELDPAIRVVEFDPAIEGKTNLPEAASVDLVVSIDVLEHVEPDYISAILDTMRDLQPKAVLLVIGTAPALKQLADGRNAHLSIHPGAWWEAELESRFNTIYSHESEESYLFVGAAKPTT